jgi:hypothetical protein
MLLVAESNLSFYTYMYQQIIYGKPNPMLFSYTVIHKSWHIISDLFSMFYYSLYDTVIYVEFLLPGGILVCESSVLHSQRKE